MNPILVSVSLFLAAGVSPDRREAAARTTAEAYYRFSVGLQARFSGDTEAALRELRAAQKLDPASARIRMEIARLLRDSGRITEAIPEAREAARLGADDPEILVVLAQTLQFAALSGSEGDKNLEEAAATYEKVVATLRADGGSLLALAQIYTQLQKPVEAARTWEKYVAVDPGSFDAHMQLGTLLLQAGETDRAAAALKQALELEPSSVRALQSLGDVYARAQQTDQAVLHFRKALEVEPENMRLRLALGEVLLRAKRYEESLAEAQAVFGLDPNNRYALDLRGRALRDMRRLDEAGKVADRLIELDQNDLKSRYLDMTIAEARRDFAAAAQKAEAVLARHKTGEDPDEASANDRIFLVHLGFAHQQLGRIQDAAQAFGRAMAAGEADPDVAGYYIEALLATKDAPRAVEEARAIRKRFPLDTGLALMEARALRDLGRSEEALALVREVRSKAQDNPEALGEIADYFRRGRQFVEAEAALAEARAKNPRSTTILFQLGAVLERQKRHDEAEAVFREALRIQPDSAPVMNYLGYMNADRNVRVPEALGLLEKSVAADPGNGAYLDSLAWAQFRMGRLDDAERNVRQALAQQARSAVILDHLGDILERRGRLDEAIVVWQRALEGEDEDDELDRERVERKIGLARSAKGGGDAKH